MRRRYLFERDSQQVKQDDRLSHPRRRDVPVSIYVVDGFSRYFFRSSYSYTTVNFKTPYQNSAGLVALPLIDEIALKLSTPLSRTTWQRYESNKSTRTPIDTSHRRWFLRLHFNSQETATC